MKYFGTDGIRGKAGDFLSPELAFRVGTSLWTLGLPAVVIGRDTRESGPMLTDGVSDGAKFVGLDVCDLGIVSTPMLSYISGRMNVIGVMITASHNPYADNGIKVFRNGKKLYAGEEQSLEEVLNGFRSVPKPQTNGRDLLVPDILPMYDSLYEGIRVSTPMRIALDLANGADYAIGSLVFSRIAKNLKITGNHPDGRNINDGVGSTHIDHLIAFVKETGSEIGFSFDGDGDRLLTVDGSGRIFDGDLLIYIIAVYLKARGQLNQSAVVLTKMSNLGIIQALDRQGIAVFPADVGDKYVLEALETHDFTLGGENSGHVINRTLLNTGDGLLNAAFLVKILEETGKSLAELTQDIVLFPDKLVNLRDVDKTLAQHPEVTGLVNTWKNRLGSDGKILVRASGTEPMIRVSVSAKSEAVLDECLGQIVELIHFLQSKNTTK